MFFCCSFILGHCVIHVFVRSTLCIAQQAPACWKGNRAHESRPSPWPTLGQMRPWQTVLTSSGSTNQWVHSHVEKYGKNFQIAGQWKTKSVEVSLFFVFIFSLLAAVGALSATSLCHYQCDFCVYEHSEDIWALSSFAICNVHTGHTVDVPLHGWNDRQDAHQRDYQGSYSQAYMFTWTIPSCKKI